MSLATGSLPYTIRGGTAPLDFAVASLPELRGYGHLPDLWTAMSQNHDLLTLAQNIAAQPLQGLAENFATISQQFDTLLYTWAGVQDDNPAGRGPFLDDARKLDFLENLLHEDFTQFRTSGVSNPLSLPAANIELIYADVKEDMAGRFIMQAGGAGLYDTPVAYDRLADTLTFDGTPHLSAAALNALGAAGAAAADPAAFWASVAYIIDATHNGANITPQFGTINGELTIGDGAGAGLASLAPDEITALDAAVHLSSPSLSWETVSANFESLLSHVPVTAGPDDDIITGTNGNDTIDGGAGNDILTAGAGGTLMEGGDGSDGYRYNFGASDYIVDTGGAQDVLMLPGSRPEGSIGFYGPPLIERVVGADGNAYDLKFVFSYSTPEHPGGVTTEIVLQDQFNPANRDAVIEEVDLGTGFFFNQSADGTIGMSANQPFATEGTAGNSANDNFHKLCLAA